MRDSKLQMRKQDEPPLLLQIDSCTLHHTTWCCLQQGRSQNSIKSMAKGRTSPRTLYQQLQRQNPTLQQQKQLHRRRSCSSSASRDVSASRQSKLARAKGYPYERPAGSYVFVAGRKYELLPDAVLSRGFGPQQLIGLLQEGVTDETGNTWRLSDVAQQLGLSLEDVVYSKYQPVLAIGSNAAPEQLLRKFPVSQFPEAFIPVIQVLLKDYDVVYAPLIAKYGSCTASLVASPGTAVSVYITYLTPPLLERMNATEGAYAQHVLPLQFVPGISLNDRRAAELLRQGLPVSQVMAYVHKSGSLQLRFQGRAPAPVALAEVPALWRHLPVLPQGLMLMAVRAATAIGGNLPGARGKPVYQDQNHTTPLNELLLGPGRSRWMTEYKLDDWIIENIDDDVIRRELNIQLKGAAVPFQPALLACRQPAPPAGCLPGAWTRVVGNAAVQQSDVVQSKGKQNCSLQ